MINFFKHKYMKAINYILMIISFAFTMNVIKNIQEIIQIINESFETKFNAFIILIIVSLILFIFTFVMHILTIGKKIDNDEITYNLFDKLYTEILVVFLIFGLEVLYRSFICDGLIIISKVLRLANINFDITKVNFMYNFTNIYQIILIGLSFIILMWPLGTIIKLIKDKNLFKNTLIYELCILIDKIINETTSQKMLNDKLRLRTIVIAILLLIPIVGYIMSIVLAVKWKKEINNDFEKIKDMTRKIKNGAYNTNTGMLYDETSIEIANNLIEIKNNIDNIIDERIKDEKDKMEMIQNASYDLKNPLESIASNLSIILKDKEISDKYKKQIEIIRNRTDRLLTLSNEINKGLIKEKTNEDNIKLEEVDLFSFLATGLSEIEEEMKKSNMKIKLNVKKSKIYVISDRNFLWRAFENLIKDVFKHGKEGTNVYIGIDEVNNNGIITIKNEIKNENNNVINMTSQEFKQKYLNGQNMTSLVVTKKLVEKQGGMLDIKIKENFFIVSIILRIAK